MTYAIKQSPIKITKQEFQIETGKETLWNQSDIEIAMRHMKMNCVIITGAYSYINTFDVGTNMYWAFKIEHGTPIDHCVAVKCKLIKHTHAYCSAFATDEESIMQAA